jgi:hypothetical protein
VGIRRSHPARRGNHPGDGQPRRGRRAGIQGDTEFSFFGQSFKSTHIGIAAIFLASALIVLNIRRVLKSVESMQQKKAT